MFRGNVVSIFIAREAAIPTYPGGSLLSPRTFREKRVLLVSSPPMFVSLSALSCKKHVATFKPGSGFERIARSHSSEGFSANF